MNNIPINTVGELKKAIDLLEKHKCIWSDTPISHNGNGVVLSFVQETDTVTINPLDPSNQEVKWNNSQVDDPRVA